MTSVTNSSQFVENVHRYMQAHGYRMLYVTDANQMLVHKHGHFVDILVFEVRRQVENIIHLCHQMRLSNDYATKPILILAPPTLSAKQAAHLLDAGVDDILRKPCEEREVIARMRALLRWSRPDKTGSIAELKLNERQHLVILENQHIFLTPIEFRLLSYLCENAPQFFSAEVLLQDVWEYPEHHGDVALVRNHIRNLRRKLEYDPYHPTILISRYGQGYTINARVSWG